MTEFHIFKTINGNPIKLEINRHNADSIEIFVHNSNYTNEKLVEIQRMVLILFCAVLYGCFLHLQIISLNITFSIVFLVQCYRIYFLVIYEKITIVQDFALLITTKYLGTKTNLFVPIKHIDDIVIKETIQKCSVIFILTVLTKGSLYQETPIVLCLNALNPNLECLKLIYNLLQDKLSQR